MQLSPIPDHIVASPETAAFYAAAVALWLVGVAAVLYRKLRQPR